MNKPRLHWLAVTGLAAAITSSTAALAAGPDRARYHDHGRMLAHLADELDLSADQESQIRALHEEVREQNAADQQRMEELHEQIRSQRDNFNPGTVQKIADEMGEITTRLVYTKASTQAEVRALLSEAQRADLDELTSDREERYQGWKEKGKHRLHRD